MAPISPVPTPTPLTPGMLHYQQWAPITSPWSPWVKPVLFAEIDTEYAVTAKMRAISPAYVPSPPGQLDPLELSQCEYLVTTLANHLQAAIVVELPGVRSVMAGVALAKQGWRPIPLYNASVGPKPLVKVELIRDALQKASSDVDSLALPPEAPPAFLIDKDRMPQKGSNFVGYDNRSVVFPQDFPSARFLVAQGISSVVLLGNDDKPAAEDLAVVLRHWEEAGLPLFRLDLSTTNGLQSMSIPRPSMLRSLIYRAWKLVGLHPNASGGFGSYIHASSG